MGRPQVSTRPGPALRAASSRERVSALRSWGDRVNLPLILIVAAAAAFAVHYALRVKGWIVMPDELQYERLALSIADRLSVIPHIHDSYAANFGQVYPLLMAPFFGLFGMTTAWSLVHAENTLVMASAAIPAYLLAKDVTRSRPASWLVAVLTVAIPWMALSTIVLTEVPGYPVFVWAAWAMYRSAVRAGWRADAVALCLIVLAFFTRTQFVLLAPLFPLILLVEGLTVRDAGPLQARVRTLLARHRLVWAACVVGGAIALVLAVRGTLDSVLGNYADAAKGDLLPPGMVDFFRQHLANIVVGAGIVPAVLAIGWALSSIVRPRDRRGHAFAVLLLVLVVAMTLEASSFNLRFSHAIQDRYLFYVVPLLFVGMAAYLLDPARRSVAVGASALGLGLWIVGSQQYVKWQVVYFASPDANFHQVFAGKAYDIGRIFGFDHLHARPLLMAGTVVLTGLILVARRRAAAARVAAVTGALVFVFCATQTYYVMHHEVGAGGGALGQRDWIDRKVPASAIVGTVPVAMDGTDPSSIWWEPELFNKTVRRAYSFAGQPLYTQFPADSLAVDWATGAMHFSRPPDYLVFHNRDTRFRPQLRRPPLDRHFDFAGHADLLAPSRPYRASWATAHMTLGWVNPGRPADLRVYQPGGWRFTLILNSTSQARAPRAYRIALGGRVLVSGRLPPVHTRQVGFRVCVPAGVPHRDLTFATAGPMRGPDGKLVAGFRVDEITNTPDPSACSRAAVRS